MTEYRCLRCRTRINPTELVDEKIQCTYCGYRILEKTRPAVIHRIRTD